MITIQYLNESNEHAYDTFLGGNDDALFYHSLKYRKLLKEFLQAEDFYLLALNEENEIEGVLPCFILRNKISGNVLNSLPFYGSNGAIVCGYQNRGVKTKLLEAFYSLAEREHCVSSTLITSPFERDVGFYERETSYTFRDERKGQVTRIDMGPGDVASKLMKSFHYKTRNCIRKAIKSDVTVSDLLNDEVWDFLISTHHSNIAALGGIPKPKEFFELIPRTFQPELDFNVYTASKNGRMVAGLLVFYYNKTVEYFTPVVLSEFRTYHPLSLIIHQAMIDAAENNYTWWNWGGTWLTQNTIYNFKKRWGTAESPYFYYTTIFDERILQVSKDEILKQYPFFFVKPFRQSLQG